MLDIIILALAGICIGTVTGLLPGLHVNTVAIIGLSMFPAIGLEPLDFAVVMTSMAITHSFLDFIPSIFLGAPEEDTALSVLPMHQLFINGQAMAAVKLTAYGSLFGLAFALLLLIPVLLFVPVIYHALRGIIVYVLIAAVLFLVVRERKPQKIIWAAFIFGLSGFLGVTVFDLEILSATQVLFPVFVGLFGLSSILASLRQETASVPQDPFVQVEIKGKTVVSGFLGAFGGMVIGILPAMSPSQIGIIMYEIIGTDLRSFIISVSAINTSDSIFSLVSLYTINNARSGVAVMIGNVLEITWETMLLLIGVIMFTAFFATILHLKIGRIASGFVDRIDYRKLCAGSFVFICLLVVVFTGWFGLLLALLSMTVGLLPILAGVSRTHVMGVLLVPTILYFLGLG